MLPGLGCKSFGLSTAVSGWISVENVRFGSAGRAGVLEQSGRRSGKFAVFLKGHWTSVKGLVKIGQEFLGKMEVEFEVKVCILIPLITGASPYLPSDLPLPGCACCACS